MAKAPRPSFEANQWVYRLRRDLLSEFGAEDKMLTFCPNVTTALNYLIKGYFKMGDHLLITALEHNALMRPLEQMRAQGVTYSIIPCDEVWLAILCRRQSLSVILKGSIEEV